MPAPTSAAPLNAWFTLQGNFVGVSGIPVQLLPGQSIDPNAWYTADGRRAAVAGPFDNAYMNRQGYLRGAQIIAADKMQQAVDKTGRTAQVMAQPVPPAGPDAAGLKLMDWTSMTIGGLGAVVQLAEWDRVKTVVEAGEKVAYWRSRRTGRWYRALSQPNRFTGPRNPTLNAANRLKWAGRVCFVAGAILSTTQIITAYDSNEPDKYRKMGKGGLDIVMGIVGFIGPVGFAISTVYFLVDTGIALNTNGGSNILNVGLDAAQDAYRILSYSGRRSQGRNTIDVLLAPADNTRVAVPRLLMPQRAAPQRSLADVLRQTPVAAHNAVFRPASR